MKYFDRCLLCRFVNSKIQRTFPYEQTRKWLRAFQYNYDFRYASASKPIPIPKNNVANVFSALSGQTFFFRRNPILLCL